jgi:hypothetical protein
MRHNIDCLVEFEACGRYLAISPRLIVTLSAVAGWRIDIQRLGSPGLRLRRSRPVSNFWRALAGAWGAAGLAARPEAE